MTSHRNNNNRKRRDSDTPMPDCDNETGIPRSYDKRLLAKGEDDTGFAGYYSSYRRDLTLSDTGYSVEQPLKNIEVEEIGWAGERGRLNDQEDYRNVPPEHHPSFLKVELASEKSVPEGSTLSTASALESVNRDEKPDPTGRRQPRKLDKGKSVRGANPETEAQSAVGKLKGNGNGAGSEEELAKAAASKVTPKVFPAKAPSKASQKPYSLFHTATSFMRGSSVNSEDRERERQQPEFNRKVEEQMAKERKSWDVAFQKYESTIHNKTQRIRDLETEMNTLLQKHTKLQDHLQSQEEQVIKAQSKALEMLDQAEWTPQEDSKIKQELNALEKAIRAWSKNSAIESFPGWRLDGLTEEELDWLRDDWEAFALLPTRGIPIPAGFESGSMDNKAWMLLAAWLTSHVYSTLFQNPFFFVKMFMRERDLLNPSEASRGGSEIHYDLQELLQQLEFAHGQDSKDVQHWRSQFLRLLDPPGATGRTDKGRYIKDLTERARRAVAERQTDSFWQSCKRFLKCHDVEKMQAALDDIMILAAHLSFRLWTQRSYLELQAGRDLLGQLYDRQNKTWIASGLHTADLENDESCMDGKAILLIFHPAVILYGDSEGADYSTRRILKQAVVWMGRQDSDNP